MSPESSQGTGTRSDPSLGAGNGGSGADPDPIRELAALLNERFAMLSRSVRTLFSVHKDRAQLAVRRRAQLAILLAAAAFAATTGIIYAIVLVVRGTVQGLTVLFDGRAWLGSLVTGLVLLSVIGIGLWYALRRWDRVQLKKSEVRYAELRRKRDGLVPRAPF